MNIINEGVNLPWSWVVTISIVGLIAIVRYTAAEYLSQRFTVRAIGTFSLLSGVVVFGLVFATLPTLGPALLAKEKNETDETNGTDGTNKSYQSYKSHNSKSHNSNQPPTKPAEAELESPIATSAVSVDRSQRPAWVEASAKQDGEQYVVSVASGPWATDAECDRVLDTKIKTATDEFIRSHLRSESAPRLLAYDLAYIKKHLVQETDVFHETLTVSFGQMRQSHARLDFGPAFRQELEERWRQVVAGSRLGQTGLAFGGVLAFLGAFFGYFKLDTATRGFYTGRLQLAVAATILLIVAAGISAALWIPWL